MIEWAGLSGRGYDKSELMATSSSDLTARHTTVTSPQEGEHQSGTDHPYYQTLLRCTPKLVTALSGSPLSIADKLLAKALISQEVYQSLLVPSLTPDNMARKMVVSVSNAVQLNSRKYVEFVQILQSDISLLRTGIIKTLHDTYSAIKIELQAQEQPQTSMSHPVDDLPTTSSSHLTPISTQLSQDIQVAQKTKISLIEKFNQIEISMKDTLKESSVTVDTFCHSFLHKLDIFEKEKHAPFFGANANLLSEASTFDALFIIFGLYWDYLNYHLLECLVREYGDADIKRSMKEYVEDVSSFMEATTLQVFWRIEPCLKSIPPPGFKETVVRYEREISKTSTLMELENIRLKMNKYTQIRKFAILLSAITEGSLLIMWFTLFRCDHERDPFVIVELQQSQRVSAIFGVDPSVPSYSVHRYSTPVISVHCIDKYFGGHIIIPSTPLSIADLPTIMIQLSHSDIHNIESYLKTIYHSIRASGVQYQGLRAVLFDPKFIDTYQSYQHGQPGLANEFFKQWITKNQNPTWETFVTLLEGLEAYSAAKRIRTIIPVPQSVLQHQYIQRD